MPPYDDGTLYELYDSMQDCDRYDYFYSLDSLHHPLKVVAFVFPLSFVLDDTQHATCCQCERGG
eukprot:scaffold60871_cov48-Attheya_sp.AAC.2